MSENFSQFPLLEIDTTFVLTFYVFEYISAITTLIKTTLKLLVPDSVLTNWNFSDDKELDMNADIKHVVSKSETYFTETFISQIT